MRQQRAKLPGFFQSFERFVRCTGSKVLPKTLWKTTWLISVPFPLRKLFPGNQEYVETYPKMSPNTSRYVKANANKGNK
jgi:hypothetical protein